MTTYSDSLCYKLSEYVVMNFLTVLDNVVVKGNVISNSDNCNAIGLVGLATD